MGLTPCDLTDEQILDVRKHAAMAACQLSERNTYCPTSHVIGAAKNIEHYIITGRDKRDKRDEPK